MRFKVGESWKMKLLRTYEYMQLQRVLCYGHILGASLAVLLDGFAAATRFKCVLERCRLRVCAWPKLPRCARIWPRPWFSSGLTEILPSRNEFAFL